MSLYLAVATEAFGTTVCACDIAMSSFYEDVANYASNSGIYLGINGDVVIDRISIASVNSPTVINQGSLGYG